MTFWSWDKNNKVTKRRAPPGAGPSLPDPSGVPGAMPAARPRLSRSSSSPRTQPRPRREPRRQKSRKVPSKKKNNSRGPSGSGLEGGGRN